MGKCFLADLLLVTNALSPVKHSHRFFLLLYCMVRVTVPNVYVPKETDHYLRVCVRACACVHAWVRACMCVCVGATRSSWLGYLLDELESANQLA